MSKQNQHGGGQQGHQGHASQHGHHNEASGKTQANPTETSVKKHPEAGTQTTTTTTTAVSTGEATTDKVDAHGARHSVGERLSAVARTRVQNLLAIVEMIVAAANAAYNISKGGILSVITQVWPLVELLRTGIDWKGAVGAMRDLTEAEAAEFRQGLPAAFQNLAMPALADKVQKGFEIALAIDMEAQRLVPIVGDIVAFARSFKTAQQLQHDDEHHAAEQKKLGGAHQSKLGVLEPQSHFDEDDLDGAPIWPVPDPEAGKAHLAKVKQSNHGKVGTIDELERSARIQEEADKAAAMNADTGAVEGNTRVLGAAADIEEEERTGIPPAPTKKDEIPPTQDSPPRTAEEIAAGKKIADAAAEKGDVKNDGDEKKDEVKK